MGVDLPSSLGRKVYTGINFERSFAVLMPNDENLSDGERGRGIKCAVADAPAPFLLQAEVLALVNPGRPCLCTLLAYIGVLQITYGKKLPFRFV
jgi:hypothetical protein